MRVTKREEDIIEKMIDLSLSLNRSIEFLAGRLSLFSSSHLSHILAFARERSETRASERERERRAHVCHISSEKAALCRWEMYT